MWSLRQMKIKCSDGSIRLVFRNPDKAFPFYAKEFKSNVDSALKVAKVLELKLKGQQQSIISGLFAQIDESNKNVQIALNAVYISFTTSPCTKDKWLSEQISLILERENKLRNLFCGLEFIKQLVLKNSEPALIDKAINRLVLANGNEFEETTKEEFHKTSKNIDKWRAQS